MRMKIMTMLGGGIVAAAMSQFATAAPPTGVTFDNWAAANGTITLGKTPPPAGTTACFTGFSCNTIATGAGFLQVELTPTGPAASKSYIMTVITDANATGVGSGGVPMSNESYVEITRSTGGGGATAPTNNNGISAKQVMRDTSGGVNFVSNVGIDTGWANAAGTPAVVMTETLDNGAALTSGDAFNIGFKYTGNNNAAGTPTGSSLGIVQTVGLKGTAASGGNAADLQQFEFVGLKGDLNPGGITATLTPSGTTTPVTVTSAKGDSFAATWIGQRIAGDGTQFFPGSNFGFSGYTNQAGTAAPTSTSSFSLNTFGPFAWPAGAGAAPVFGQALTPN